MPTPKVALTLLVLVVGLAYANSIRVPFVYDDILAIPGNPSIRQLWPLTEVLLPRVEGGVTVSGRPVLNLSFALNHAISGPEVWSYHVFNILIHTANALLLYGIVRRTLQTSRKHERSPAANNGASARGEDRRAILIAAIWALHPLQTQAVTYTVQRAESLMGMFYLLTLYAFIRAATVDDEPSHNRRTKWFGLAVAGCALGMGTKEVMATAPLVVLLYDRTFLAGTWAAAWRARGRWHLTLMGTWGILAALMSSTGGNRGGTVGLGVGLSLWSYPLTQFKALATYLKLCVWPEPLVFEYGTWWATSAADVLPFAMLIVPLLGLTVFAVCRHSLSSRWRAAGFLGAAFFVILAPTSLAPGTIQMIVEHRMYLPLAAVVTAGVLGLGPWPGNRTSALSIAVLIALTFLTVRRNHDYRTNLALWQDTVAKRPENPRAYEGLAETLEAAGQRPEALALRRQSVAHAPANAEFRFNLALALANAGRKPEAIDAYREALRLRPDEARTHNNLAVLLAAAGEAEEALRHYATAVRLKPDETAYRQNLGTALLRAGKADEALAEFGAAARVARPGDIGPAMRYGTLLAQHRRFEEAAAVFEQVLPHATDNPAVRLALADALLDADRVVAAIPHYEALLKISPEHPEAHHNLGAAFARLERWAEAQREFETALRLKPGYEDARKSLEQLRRVAPQLR